MSGLITDAMVEAAARAEWTHEWPIRPWEKAPDGLADHYRGCSRHALEAAAPLIAAKALRDAANEYNPGVIDRSYLERYLQNLADRIERGES